MGCSWGWGEITPINGEKKTYAYNMKGPHLVVDGYFSVGRPWRHSWSGLWRCACAAMWGG